MQVLAPRPSAASIKTYERSESIVAFAFLNPCPVFANNCPHDRAKRGQKVRAKRVHRAVIHRFFEIFPFLYIFKYF